MQLEGSTQNQTCCGWMLLLLMLPPCTWCMPLVLPGRTLNEGRGKWCA